jgi:hypothetical protein
MNVHPTPPTDAPTQSLNGPSPAGPPKSSRTRVGLIAAAGGLSLVVLAVAAMLIVSSSHSSSQTAASQTASAVYQQKLSTALAPVVPANLSLSSALQGVDGSKSTLHQAQMASTAALAAVSTASGAVAILTVPSADTTLSQQTQQALVQETGYLQGVSSTLSDPIGQSSSSLRSLATNTQAAFVPIASVAPGGSTSISGTGNLLAWAAGANAAATTKTPAPATTTTTTTVAPAAPATTGSGLGQSLSYCSTGVYVNSATTCPFAENVFVAYFAQYSANGDTFGNYAVQATSPATGTTYTDECQESADGSQIYCSHGTDLVNLTTAAIAAY